MESIMNAHFDFFGPSAREDAQAVRDALGAGGAGFGWTSVQGGGDRCETEVVDAPGWSWPDLVEAMRSCSEALSRAEGHVVLESDGDEVYVDVVGGAATFEQSETVRVPARLEPGLDLGALRVVREDPLDEEYWPFFVDAASVAAYLPGAGADRDPADIDSACRSALDAGAPELCDAWSLAIAEMLDGGDDATPACRVKEVALQRACRQLGGTAARLAEALEGVGGPARSPDTGSRPPGNRTQGELPQPSGVRGHSAVATAFQGPDGPVLATVEASSSRGMPGLTVLGPEPFMASAISQRVRAAMRSQGFSIPRESVVVDVHPRPPAVGSADTELDLPVAAAVLAATGQIPASAVEGRLLTGSLGLGGDVRGAVRNADACAAVARDRGLAPVGGTFGGVSRLRDLETAAPRTAPGTGSAQRGLDADLAAARATRSSQDRPAPSAGAAL